MKNIIGFISITVLLFACSKTDIPSTQNSEAVATEKAKGGNGNGGGGGGSALVVTTDEASYILPFGAISGGNVSSSGGGNKVTVRGVCFSINSEPTIDDEKVISGSGSGTFTSVLSWLDDGTTYYVRAYASKTKNGTTTTTTYGDELYFTTPSANYGTVDDIDGNTYTTIEIGTQVWMMENLKTTKYRDGTLIPNETDDVLWAGLSSGAYCNYGNNVSNVATYGRLYNWYAVDDAHNIAPTGWHVATTAEWQTLVNYVGGGALYDAGAKLKEAGFAHWDPSTISNEGNNSSGLTAVGSGERSLFTSSAPFRLKKQRGNWWTATGSGGIYADFVYLQSSTAAILGSGFGGTNFDNYDKKCGYSVRCVQD